MAPVSSSRASHPLTGKLPRACAWRGLPVSIIWQPICGDDFPELGKAAMVSDTRAQFLKKARRPDGMAVLPMFKGDRVSISWS
jgi:hypothetical protein